MEYGKTDAVIQTDESCIGLFCALYFGAEINKKRGD